jgi:hypothetical protein
MKIILLAIGVSACLASAASAQGAKPAAEQALSGTWKCSADSPEAAVTSTTVYLPGGKETFDVLVKVAQADMEFTASGAGDWKLQPDGKVAETITSLTVKTAKMNGQDVPVADMQSMVEGMIVNQTSTSTIELKDGGMTLTDQDGVTSTCKR